MMEVDFVGGLALEARIDEHVIRADQPVADGGQDSGPAPYDLLLASIATCAGYCVLRFCQTRDIDTAGITLTLDWPRDPETRRIERFELRLGLPAGFPEKYRPAVLRAIHACSVKKTLLDPPPFDVALA